MHYLLVLHRIFTGRRVSFAQQTFCFVGVFFWNQTEIIRFWKWIWFGYVLRTIPLEVGFQNVLRQLVLESSNSEDSDVDVGQEIHFFAILVTQQF